MVEACYRPSVDVSLRCSNPWKIHPPIHVDALVRSVFDLRLDCVLLLQQQRGQQLELERQLRYQKDRLIEEHRVGSQIQRMLADFR